LAIVTVAGASKGLDITGSPVIAVVTGILTGTMGGNHSRYVGSGTVRYFAS
jgi:uncharacterized membrane protein YeiH